MKNFNFKILMLIVVGIVAIGARASQSVQLENKEANLPIVAKCKADLAKRLKLESQNIKVIEVQAINWPDASLGMPEIDKVYAQVITPGFKIILEGKSSQYLYTASTKTYKYGGPTSIWSLSMLYTKPIENEPNFNADLYQCSLLGTSSVRLVSEVADYYPQAKGVVLVKRRTSRSGHDLLYVKADGSGKTKTLHSGLDFGEATLNDAQNEWAGFVRPSLGTNWTIVIAGIDQNAKKQTLSLPEGVQPRRIAWSGENLMILVQQGEKTLCFETSPKAVTPEWKAVAVHTFPGLPEYMLNKSESLEINQINENGKPSVEVARVWFTGDRNVVAKINDFTLHGQDFLGRLAIIWGEKGSKSAAYTVDIVTGEVISIVGGISRDIKPFMFPPQNSPIISSKS